MAVMTHFLLDQWKNQEKLNGTQFVASTIVSTPMIEKIAEDFGVIYKEGLTGFKWIAKMVKDHPELELIGGGEESFGYMVGDFVRDKDAVTATLLACEIAASAKAKGTSFYGYLQQLYEKYGVFREELISFVKKGKKGAEEIEAMMDNLRSNPLKEVNNSRVIRIEDYQTGISTDMDDGAQKDINLPKSNVLIYYTSNGTKIAARPSGTEPKIKFYISVRSTDPSRDFESLSEDITRIKKELNL